MDKESTDVENMDGKELWAFLYILFTAIGENMEEQREDSRNQEETS